MLGSESMRSTEYDLLILGVEWEGMYWRASELLQVASESPRLTDRSETALYQRFVRGLGRIRQSNYHWDSMFEGFLLATLDSRRNSTCPHQAREFRMESRPLRQYWGYRNRWVIRVENILSLADVDSAAAATVVFAAAVVAAALSFAAEDSLAEASTKRNSRRQSGEWREEQQSDCAKCLRRLRGRLRILGNGPRAVRPPLAVGYSSG